MSRKAHSEYMWSALPSTAAIRADISDRRERANNGSPGPLVPNELACARNVNSGMYDWQLPGKGLLLGATPGSALVWSARWLLILGRWWHFSQAGRGALGRSGRRRGCYASNVFDLALIVRYGM